MDDFPTLRYPLSITRALAAWTFQPQGIERHRIMTTTVRPTGTRLTVQRDVADEKTSGGIYIPKNATEKPIEGTVLAVGPLVNDRAPDRIPVPVTARLAPGQKVLFGKYAGTEVSVDGKDVLIIDENDILAVLDRSE